MALLCWDGVFLNFCSVQVNGLCGCTKYWHMYTVHMSPTLNSVLHGSIHLHYKDGLAFYIAGQCLEPYCVGNKLMIKTHPQNNTHYIMGHMAKNSRSLLWDYSKHCTLYLHTMSMTCVVWFFGFNFDAKLRSPDNHQPPPQSMYVLYQWSWVWYWMWYWMLHSHTQKSHSWKLW